MSMVESNIPQKLTMFAVGVYFVAWKKLPCPWQREFSVNVLHDQNFPIGEIVGLGVEGITLRDIEMKRSGVHSHWSSPCQCLWELLMCAPTCTQTNIHVRKLHAYRPSFLLRGDFGTSHQRRDIHFKLHLHLDNLKYALEKIAHKPMHARVC